MWGQTRQTVILGWMRDAVLREPEPDDDPVKFDARRAVIQKEIDKRTADVRFSVNVKHIGGPDDPTLYDQMVAREESARHAARVRARRALESDGLPHTQDNVSDAMGRDPEWVKALGDAVKAWVVAGLVDGAQEYRRLGELGDTLAGAGGGGRLLLDAAYEVKRYQGLTDDEGKG